MTDTVELQPSGTIVLRFGDWESTLRRPTLRELRELIASASSEKLDPEAQMTANLEWVRRALNLLGANQWMADLDDFPPFVIAAEFASELVKHWRTVPLVRG